MGGTTIRPNQQLTGIVSLAFYTRQIGPHHRSLALAKIAGVAAYTAFFIDAFGRRKTFLVLTVAIGIVKDPANSVKRISSAGAAGMEMTCFKAFALSHCWEPGMSFAQG